jgi:hypothetical protein
MRDQTGTLVDTDTLLAISPADDTATDRLRRAAATRKVSLFVAAALITGLVPGAIALIVAGVETHLERQVISNSAFDLLITCMAVGFVGALIGCARDSMLRYLHVVRHDQSRIFDKLDMQGMLLGQIQEALAQLPHAVEEYGDERSADARVQAIREAVHVPYQAGGGRPQLLRQQG